jgi:hypothetical protein
VTLRLDGRPYEARADRWRVSLGPGPAGDSMIHIQLDEAAPVVWSELDRLAELTEVSYAGTDAGLEAYVRTRPRLRTLVMTRHGRATIDLRGSHVGSFSCDLPGGAFTLHLPESAQKVTFFGPGGVADVTVTGARAGLELSFAGAKPPEPGLVAGLERAGEVACCNVPTLSARALTGYREAAAVRFVRVGELRDLDALAGLPRLAELSFHDCYRLDGLGPLPALRELNAVGVRKPDAALLKSLLPGAKLSVQDLRTDAWVRANVDNPFQKWADDFGAAAGRAASGAWKKAVTELERAVASGAPPAVRAALEAFVATLTKLDAKQPLDTTQREDVTEAFERLRASAGSLAPAMKPPTF